MKSFLYAEAFCMEKDPVLKTICMMLLAASAALFFWLGSVSGGLNINNILEPLGLIVSVPIFLYFIIPFHACFFNRRL